MTRIEYMYLENNNLNGTLPAEWSSMTRMLVLALHDNQFSGILPANFPMPNGGCYFSGNDFRCPLPGDAAGNCGATCGSTTANLDAAELAAWQAGFDAMGGNGWTPHCSDKRNDPCGCSKVTCSGGHITVVVLSNNQLSGLLPVEWSRMTQLERMVHNYNQLSGPLPAKR